MQRAIVFGCGKMCKDVYPKLLEEYSIVALSDNNDVLWGKTINELGFGEGGVLVVPPTEIIANLGDGIVIICVFEGKKEIFKQLKNMGVKRISALIDGVCADYDIETGDFWGDYYRQLPVLPEQLEIALTGYCNLKCPYCLAHSEFYKYPLKKKHMSWEILHEITRQLSTISSLETLVLCGLGEPLLNPEWFEMAKQLIYETSMKNIDLSTNGMLLNEENVEKLISLNCEMTIKVSIDGNSPQEHEFWRKGSSYSLVKKNVNHAIKNMKSCTIRFVLRGLSLVPYELGIQSKWHEVEEYFGKCGEYLRYDFPHSNVSVTHVGIEPAFGALPGTVIKRFNADTQNTNCNLPFKRISINHLGDIMNCNIYSGRKIIGNVMLCDLYDTWLNNSLMISLREEFRKGSSLEMCKLCHMIPGEREWLAEAEVNKSV
ncbi:MAG: radical SAM protein [Lachnospiraceae bacterium]|nr:radical SAM protein [Lachnospiraceae bacterium]